MHLNHEILIGAEERGAAIEAADLVLAASGTVTLGSRLPRADDRHVQPRPLALHARWAASSSASSTSRFPTSSPDARSCRSSCPSITRSIRSSPGRWSCFPRRRRWSGCGPKSEGPDRPDGEARRRRQHGPGARENPCPAQTTPDRSAGCPRPPLQTGPQAVGNVAGPSPPASSRDALSLEATLR